MNGKKYSKEVKVAVIVVVLGVGVCTVTDVKVNAKGFICACVAVLSTSLQQIVSLILGKYFLLFYFIYSITLFYLSVCFVIPLHPFISILCSFPFSLIVSL